MRRNNKAIAAALVGLLMNWPSIVFPCGVCERDDLAAVYDHHAAEKVKAHPERLEYVVVKVTGKLTKEKEKTITSWLLSRKGVDATTIRISTAQRAIGFVLDRNFDKHELVKDLGKTFRGLKFESKEVEF